MSMHRITPDEAGSRLDKVMAILLPEFSRQTIQKWIKAGHIAVDGLKKKPNYSCSIGELLSWSIPVESKREIVPENIPLDIIYEDDDVMVVNKPKGMLVHPTYQVQRGTLVNALMYHASKLSDASGEERLGIVHRLDQDTSGLLVIAKDNTVHEQLKEQFKAQQVRRIYEAVVYGVVQHEHGIIHAPIGRNPKNRLQMTVVDDGRAAETHFNVLTHYKNHTHVQCELKTGRTHQIRVHMKYMGHPVVGDELYVRKKTSLIKGQALVAKELGFTHPVTEERLTFDIDRPKDFQSLLNYLEQM